MKIDVLCNDGSPLGVRSSDIYGLGGRMGVGGAELALLTMCEAWTKAGHDVTLYNDPYPNGESPFLQRMVSSFKPEDDRDILIVFRSPNPRIQDAKGKIVWWSCDQYTVGSFREFAQKVSKIVTISPFHSRHFATEYEIRESTPIDLPVRYEDYQADVEKVKNRIIFTSVPDRGLNNMKNIFAGIRNKIPDASLVITSDYRLWGNASPSNQDYVMRFLREENVQFLGAIPRADLIKEQLKAQLHVYPCTYDELFCISVAESQVAGAYPITTRRGSLQTTNMGLIVDGSGSDQATQKVMIEKSVELLQDPQLEKMQKELSKTARHRFSIERILKEWDEKVFK